MPSSQKYVLNIKLDDNLPVNIVEYYKNLELSSISSTDSGIDLPLVKDYEIKNTERETFNFGIKCEMRDQNNKTVPYYLYPRSSISKTPLIQTNSVGIIDKDYRGNVMGKVVCLISNSTIELNDTSESNKFFVKVGTRLFQICSRDLEPVQVKIVDSLTETERGEGGFGSTGSGI
tara:strand:- start:894 stop:1418 length:525 start_codon:yes stop_codon:yes gene_type:complete